MPSIQALVKNRTAPKLQAKSKGNSKAELLLYGTVGSSWFEEGITAKAVAKALSALDPDVKELDIRISSGGGDVFEGIAIYNRLLAFKGKRTVYIDGLAASIASIIALAGDEVIMGEGAFYMVHLPWTFAMGNRNDLDAVQELLVRVEDQMVGIYAKKSKLPREEIRTMMVKETWLVGEEAVEKGFADKADGEALPVAASAFESPWMRNVPKAARNAESEAIRSEVKELRQKIEAKLARK